MSQPFFPPSSGDLITAPQKLAEGVRFAALGGGPPPYVVGAYIKTDGTLWTFGLNYYYQLGHVPIPTDSSIQPPKQISTDVAQVSIGHQTLHFVRNDGSLWGCGIGSVGEIGSSSPLDNFVRAPIQVADYVVAVSSSYHLLVRKRDGSIWGAGANYFGQLGLGTTVTGIYGLAPIVEHGGLAVSAAYQHSALLVVPPPSIELEPTPRVVRRGERVDFSVIASGAGTLVYQWRHDGEAHAAPSARTANLVIDAAEFSDAGNYDVEVSLAGVKSKSGTASLVVHDEEHTSFAAWASANGVEVDPLSDPDGDHAGSGGVGTPALLRYAFKQAARGGVASPCLATAENDDDGLHLSLSFPRKTHAPGLRYVVEASDDLADWRPLATVAPGWPELVTVRDNQVLKDTRRRFMRVRVELEP